MTNIVTTVLIGLVVIIHGSFVMWNTLEDRTLHLQLSKVLDEQAPSLGNLVVGLLVGGIIMVLGVMISLASLLP